jgi:hypothetical protein
VSRWPADCRVELEAFWRSHHEAWRRSDLNQRDYCEAHSLPLKRFGNWRAKFKQEPAVPEKLLYRRSGGLSHMTKKASHMTSGVGLPVPWCDRPRDRAPQLRRWRSGGSSMKRRSPACLLPSWHADADFGTAVDVDRGRRLALTRTTVAAFSGRVICGRLTRGIWNAVRYTGSARTVCSWSSILLLYPTRLMACISLIRQLAAEQTRERKASPPHKLRSNAFG